MDLSNLKSEAEKILSSAELNPLEKVKGIDNLMKPNFSIRNTYSVNTEERVEGQWDMLTELSNSIRDLVRESAWGGETPISFKEALNSPDILPEDTWDILETMIDHDRDMNWNYVNLVQFNLKHNKKADGSGFWLSPQHFRMAAIVDTVSRELNTETGFDLDLVKALYKNENQIPQAIEPAIKTLRHI